MNPYFIFGGFSNCFSCNKCFFRFSYSLIAFLLNAIRYPVRLFTTTSFWLFSFLTRRTGNCFICFSPFCFSNLMHLYGSTFLYNMQHIFDEYRKYIFFLPDRHYGAVKVPAGCPPFVNYTASSGIASMLIFHTLQPPVVTTLHKHWEVSYVHFLLLSQLLYLQVNPLSSYFNPIGRRNVFKACVVAKLSVFMPGFLHAVHEKLRTTGIKNNRFSLPYDWGKSRTAFSLYAFVFPIYSLPYYTLYGAFPLKILSHIAVRQFE